MDDPSKRLNRIKTGKLPRGFYSSKRQSFVNIYDRFATSFSFNRDRSKEFEKFQGTFRMSLLGKPLSYRPHRKDFKCRRLQMKIYNFLERPRGLHAATYHVLVLIMVLLCLGLSVFSTIPEYSKNATEVLYYLEVLFVGWLTLEYLFRIWSVGCRSRYRGWTGRMHFATSPFCIIDIIVIVASIAVLCLGSTGQVFAASAIRGLRFFQILRMVRIDRRGGTWKLLGSVVWAHRQELVTTLYIGFLGLIFASFLVYLCEKNINQQYETFADALWWGVITLSTVGYGDKYPVSWCGKIVASFCALLGISFFALPAGILGSGFALKVQQHQRQKHIIRRRVPAATLIQCSWRLYCADEDSTSIATWRIHLKSQPEPQPPSDTRPLMSVLSDNVEVITDSVKDTVTNLKETWTTRFKQNPNQPWLMHRITRATKSTGNRRPTGCISGLLEPKSPHGSRSPSIEVQRNVIAAVRDQDATIHDVVGDAVKAIGRNKSVDSGTGNCVEDYGLMIAPFAKWCSSMKIRQDQEKQEKASRSLTSSTSCPQQNSEDDEVFPPEDENDLQLRTLDQLTEVHRNAIRAIRRIKLLVARRKFREALRPYDVKDVIEQYSAGHVDLLARVKTIQQRLETILGKQPTSKREIVEAKTPMLSRLVKVERQMGDVERKIDILIKMYVEDRQRNKNNSPDQLQDCNNPTGNQQNSLLSGPKTIYTPFSPSTGITKSRTLPLNLNAPTTITAQKSLTPTPTSVEKIHLASSLEPVRDHP